MKLYISNVITITDYTKDIELYCKNNLTFPNPDFEKRKRMGFYVGNISRFITVYSKYNDIYYLPIGSFNDLWKIHPITDDWVDFSNDKPVNVVSNIKLRDYQVPCLDAIKKYYNGLFILPAGTGKTLTALACFGELKQKTLWLTHTQDLLNQAKTECESNMICKTSTITKGKCDYSGDIVFATIQTLSNVIDKEEIPQDAFGMVIGDEIQHCIISGESVMQFQKCMNYFASRYKLGLTATLHTSNGLHKVIPYLIGDIIYELKKVDDKLIGIYENKNIVSVNAADFQIPARIYYIYTNYSVMGKDIFMNDNQTVSFSKLLTDIAEDTARNKLILDLLSSLKGSTIVVSDRTSQLKELASYFDNAFFVDSSTKKAERERGLDLVRKGEIKYLFATYKLICEGFNAPILENLVMATPVKDLRIVIQSIGRVQRPYKGKKYANVYDIVDDVGKLDKFLRERKKIYKQQNYEIMGG